MRRCIKYSLLICLLFCLVFQSLFAQNSGKNLHQLPKPFENYNVVLVFIDTLRADRLSCYGYRRKTSPNIDKLSQESFTFEQNFTPVTYTLPSFMSIDTSLYPNSHAVLEIYKDKLSNRVTTLAQILNTYGYKTAWFGPLLNPYLSPEVGFGRGFDELTDHYSSPNLEESKKIILDWLGKNKDKKFFLNFHTYKLHSPYIPNLKYKQRFTKTKKMEGIIEDWQQFYFDTVQKALPDKKLVVDLIGEDLFNQFTSAGLDRANNKQIEDFFISKGRLIKLWAIREAIYWHGINFQDSTVNAYVQDLYDADIAEYDEEVIAPVIAKLKALKLYDKTILIICADHGEEFYEHGGYSHGRTLYDELTHVPLIIRIPWIKQGRHIKELTQTVDIMPTLLELLGIPLPHQTQGKSLVSLINNKRPLPLHEYVFGRTLGGVSSIRSKDWLLILHDNDPDQKELYSIHADPKEQHNIYSDNQNTALKLESKLKEWEGSLPSYRDQEYAFPPEIDKATQERIKKTGYW